MRKVRFRSKEPRPKPLRTRRLERNFSFRHALGILDCLSGLAHEIQTSYCCRRRERIRRVDGVAPAGTWRSSDSARRLGTGELTGFVRRRNASHAGNLWPRSALHGTGRASVEALGEIRATMEAAVPAPDRCAVD